MANEFAHSLGHPDLNGKLCSFIADQTHTKSDSNMSLMDSSDNQPPEFDDLTTLYPSDVATYFSQSDLSGIGGMHYDTIFFNTNPNEDGMHGLDVAWVKQLFHLSLRVTSIHVLLYNGIPIVMMSLMGCRT